MNNLSIFLLGFLLGLILGTILGNLAIYTFISYRSVLKEDIKKLEEKDDLYN